MGGGTQNAPCIGIVASRIGSKDTPTDTMVTEGGFPEAVGTRGRLLILPTTLLQRGVCLGFWDQCGLWAWGEVAYWSQEGI